MMQIQTKLPDSEGSPSRNAFARVRGVLEDILEWLKQRAILQAGYVAAGIKLFEFNRRQTLIRHGEKVDPVNGP